MCDIMDLFLRKPFWFFLSMFSILGSMRLGSRALYILAAMDVRVRAIGLMSRVLANGQGDQGSIPSRVIPKTQKMILDVSLLITQHYKVRIKGKVGQSREWTSTLPYSFV